MFSDVLKDKGFPVQGFKTDLIKITQDHLQSGMDRLK